MYHPVLRCQSTTGVSGIDDAFGLNQHNPAVVLSHEFVFSTFRNHEHFACLKSYLAVTKFNIQYTSGSSLRVFVFVIPVIIKI